MQKFQKYKIKLH